MIEDLKKGLSLIAVGFLFTLVNLNLSFSGGTICITPDFVGWILFSIAYFRLGSYVSGKSYLLYMSLTMIVLSGALWILDIARPELDAYILQIIANIVSTAYMFLLFGVLVKIADDAGSAKSSTLRFLQYFNLVIGVVLVIVSLSAKSLSVETLAAVVLVVGVVALVAAIVTMVVLFQLRKEIRRMD